MAMSTLAMAYFASAQHRLERSRLKLERYDRTFELYNTILTFTHDLFNFEDAEVKSRKFIKDCREAEYLAGRQVNDLVFELYKKGIALSRLRRQFDELRHNTSNPQFQSVVAKIEEIEDWIHHQQEIVRGLFKPLLSLDEPSITFTNIRARVEDFIRSIGCHD